MTDKMMTMRAFGETRAVSTAQFIVFYDDDSEGRAARSELFSSRVFLLSFHRLYNIQNGANETGSTRCV